MSFLTWAGDPFLPTAPLLLAPPHFHAPRPLLRRGQVLHVLFSCGQIRNSKEVRVKFHVPNSVLRDGAWSTLFLPGPRSGQGGGTSMSIAYLERKQGLQAKAEFRTLHICGNHLTTLLSPVVSHPALPTPCPSPRTWGIMGASWEWGARLCWPELRGSAFAPPRRES